MTGVRALTFVLSLILLALLSDGAEARAAKRPPVSVFPSPGTRVASDRTTFSFRYIKPSDLGPIRVVGRRSGRHGGRRLAHSDGRGVSFLPKRRFRPGELVTVFTRRRIRGARGGRFRVRIGRFPDGRKPTEPRPRSRLPALVTRPDLRPPILKVHRTGASAAPGKFFFAPKATGLTIADNEGRISWFLPTFVGEGPGQVVQNFRAQRYLGKPVLTYYRAAASPNRRWQVRRFHIRDQNYRQIARFGMGNGYRPDAHEFSISPRNTALVISYRAVRWGHLRSGRNRIVIDDVIQELDIKTGAVLFEWHSLGNVPITDSVVRSRSGPGSWDYFHANSVKDDGDSFLVSARKVSTIYRIDRRSGKIKWRLRGDGKLPGSNDFNVGPRSRFGYQHDVRRLPNGDISLFDNSVGKWYAPIRRHSSALVLRLYWRRGRKPAVGLVRRFGHRLKVKSRSQGSARLLPDGNALVGWGSVRRITEFTPQGRLAFDATFTAPVNAYQAQKFRWEGHPQGRPAVASKPRENGSGLFVWASWNGADRIASWRVLIGPDGGHLDQAALAPWNGLETRIPTPGGQGDRIRVEALDSAGNVLGRSPVIPVGTRSRR